jgi:membrane protease YdiL (CAAX protease family)
MTVVPIEDGGDLGNSGRPDVGSPDSRTPGAPGSGDAGSPNVDRSEGRTSGLPDARPSDEPDLSDRLVALFEVVLCSGFPTQILIGQLLALAGMRPVTPDGHYSSVFVFTLSLVDAVVLVSLVALFLRQHGESPRAVLFGRRPLLPEGVLGVLLIPIVFLLAVLVLVLVHLFAPGLHNVARNPLASLMKSRGDAVLFGLVAIVSGGVREEVQRAFILHRFDRYLGGGVTGIVVFSLVFGSGHVIQGWDAAIATATLGAFWGTVYLVRRSIGAPLISHAGFDLAEIIRYTAYGLHRPL